MLEVFLKFVILGFCSFGGGYVFLPLMETELVEKLGWLNHDQFIIALTAGQVSPGPIAVAGSFAGFLVGYNFYGNFPAAILCSFLAWMGTNTSTIVCMPLIMKVYHKLAKSPATCYIRHYLMPSVIGLIFYLALKMGVGSLVSVPQIIIAVVAFILAYTKKIDYAFIIIGGGIVGYLFLK